jgi:hypothetical protein
MPLATRAIRPLEQDATRGSSDDFWQRAKVVKRWPIYSPLAAKSPWAKGAIKEQKELLETESSLRGILRGFGLKVGKTTPVQFEGRIRARCPTDIADLACRQDKADRIAEAIDGDADLGAQAAARAPIASSSLPPFGRRLHAGAPAQWKCTALNCRSAPRQAAGRRTGGAQIARILPSLAAWAHGPSTAADNLCLK